MKFFILCLCLALVGCADRNDASVVATNKATLSGNGETVGTLPDGRVITRYRIDMGSGPGSHDHWVYVTNGSISINRNEQSGKTTYNEVQVILDGQRYNLTPSKAEND